MASMPVFRRKKRMHRLDGATTYRITPIADSDTSLSANAGEIITGLLLLRFQNLPKRYIRLKHSALHSKSLSCSPPASSVGLPRCLILIATARMQLAPAGVSTTSSRNWTKMYETKERNRERTEKLDSVAWQSCESDQLLDAPPHCQGRKI